MTMWIFVAVFFAILFVLALIHYRLNKEFKIETSWLALGLAPVVIWLLATGQLAEFSGFGLAFKLNQATAQPVSLQQEGSLIEPEQISADEKEGLSKIPAFVEKKVAALRLNINKPNYYSNWAIKQYLQALTPYPFFKYVLFTRTSGEFMGIMDASQLLFEMRENNLDVVARLESGNVTTLGDVTTASIEQGSSKEKALQLMSHNNLSELPVVNEKKQLIGMVERDRITSSIVAKLVASNK